MKKQLVIMFVAVLIFTLALILPASADVENGAKLFKANCTVCHLGGRNVIMASKTLKKDALEKYGMRSIEAIAYQVQNGKNAMPAFGGRLSVNQIQDLAAYVLDQSDKGW